jgi:DNA-directed RNA polymerase beta subunit
MADIFLNEIFVGSCGNPINFVKDFRKKRRSGEIEDIYNIYYDEKIDSIIIESTAGRVRRPLIIVENGVSKLTPTVLKKITSEEWNFDDLIKNGVVEFLDAMEENDAYVAMFPEEVTVEHTHLEISPLLMFGLNTGTVPYLNYDEPSRLMRGQKTIKQAVGMYALNYLLRKETDRNLLVNPQRPLVDTFVYNLLGFENHPAGQNLVVAIMSYEGYNMEDGLILNQSSVERGLQRSFYYKLHSTSEIKYPGGLQDRIALPSKDVKGYREESDYRFLEDDGVIYPGQYVETGDVIVGK